jgi:nitrogen regulatory protein P-II 1
MKEIKAYIRPQFINSLVERLEESGAKDMTVIRLDALGALADSEFSRWHIIRRYAEKYSQLLKIEIVCHDREAPGFVEIIRETAHTGRKGDGRIFVSDVEQAVNIRTGEEGEKAL